MKERLVSRSSILISLAILLIIGFAILTILGFQDKAKYNDINKIKRVIMEAEDMENTIYLLPEAYNSSPEVEVPNEVIDSMNKKVISECQKYYSAKSGLLADRIKVLQMAVDAQAKDKESRVVKNINKSIKFIDLNINGDTATVIADISGQATIISLVPQGVDINKYKTSNKKEEIKPEMKAKMEEDIKNAPKKLVTNSPEGTMRFYYNLAKEDGVWKITSRKGDFLPGQGP